MTSNLELVPGRSDGKKLRKLQTSQLVGFIVEIQEACGGRGGLVVGCGGVKPI